MTNINLDREGNLTGIEPRNAHQRVVATRLDRNTLDLRTHDDDTNESFHYRLTLNGDNQGRIALIFSDPGAPTIKPWVVKRK